MQYGYSEEELAQIKKDEERKRQFEEDMKLYVAERNGIEKGEAKLIKTFFKNGFDVETISKALDLDINYVKEVLSK